MTYTFATLEISTAAYLEIATKLRAAGYDQAFTDGRINSPIDMHGFGLTCEPQLQVDAPTSGQMPPAPFSYEIISAKGKEGAAIGNGHVYILDADGRKIASLWGKPAEKLAMAELFCNASEQVKP